MSKKHYLLFIAAVILSLPILAFSSGFWSPPAGSAPNEPKILFEKATVMDIIEEKLSPDPVIPDLEVGYQQIQIRIDSGPYKGETYFLKNSISRMYNVKADEGRKLIVRMILENKTVQGVNVFNYDREGLLLTIIVLFIAVLLIFGRAKGLRSILALIFTGFMIIFFMVPLLLKGYDSIMLSLVTVSIVAAVCFLLVGQWNKKTLAALIGTIGGVFIAGLISYIAGQIGHLSGITMNEAEELLYLASDRGMKVKGLMFSAILIASLGAVMDVAMSIASAVVEFYEINNKLTLQDLWRSGMNVGRDVMGTMADTLILAFAGSSLNVIILIAAFRMPYRQIMNLDLIGSEIVLSLSGSIGIVMTVPLTAFISAWIMTKKHSAD